MDILALVDILAVVGEDILDQDSRVAVVEILVEVENLVEADSQAAMDLEGIVDIQDLVDTENMTRRIPCHAQISFKSDNKFNNSHLDTFY